MFFGCRSEAGDFLYREEWEALAGDPIALLGHPELRTFTNDTKRRSVRVAAVQP